MQRKVLEALKSISVWNLWFVNGIAYMCFKKTFRLFKIHETMSLLFANPLGSLSPSLSISIFHCLFTCLSLFDTFHLYNSKLVRFLYCLPFSYFHFLTLACLYMLLDALFITFTLSLSHTPSLPCFFFLINLLLIYFYFAPSTQFLLPSFFLFYTYK